MADNEKFRDQNKDMAKEDTERTTGFDPSQSRAGGEAGVTDVERNTGQGTVRPEGTNQGISGRQNKQDWERNKRE